MSVISRYGFRFGEIVYRNIAQFIRPLADTTTTTITTIITITITIMTRTWRVLQLFSRRQWPGKMTPIHIR